MRHERVVRGSALGGYTTSVQRQFVATAYVFDDEGRVLMLWHPKHKRWLPPGGHLDENELPEEAAIRECKEETGLDVEIVEGGADFYGRNRIQGTTMKLPAAMFLENIPAFGGTAEKPAQPEHQHMDFVFVCRRKDPSQPIAPESPDDVVRWFTMDDVRAMGPGEIYENARSFILSR